MKNKILICFLLFTTIFVLIHGIGNTKIETNNSEFKLESPKAKPLIPKNSTHKNVKNSQTKASAKVKPEEQSSQTEIEKKDIKQKSDSKSNAGVNMSLKRVLSAGALSGALFYKAKARIHSENFWSELNVDKNASVELIEIMANNLKSSPELSSDNKMLIQKSAKPEENHKSIKNKDINILFIENLKKFIKDEQKIEIKKEILEKIKKDLENRSETKIEEIKILIEKLNKLKITKNEEVEEANKLAENEWNKLKNKIIYRMEELSVEIYENSRDEIIKEIYKYSDLQREKGKKINSLKIFYKDSKSQLETEKKELKNYILTIEEKKSLENVMKAERNFTEIISKAQKIVNIKPTQKQKEGKEEENKEENNKEEIKNEKKEGSLMKIVRTKSVDSLATMAKEIKNKTKNNAELEIEKLLKACKNLEKKWDEIKNIGTSIDLFNEKIFDLEDEIKGIINEIEADKYFKEGEIISEEKKGEKHLNKEELKEKQLEEFKKKFKKLKIFNENKVELKDEYTELEEKFLADKNPLINELKPILNQIRNKAAIIYLIYKLDEIKNVKNNEKNVKIFTKEFLEKIESKALEQMKIFNGGEKEELNLTTIEFRLSTFNILIGHAKGKIFFENKLLGNNIKFMEDWKVGNLWDGMF